MGDVPARTALASPVGQIVSAHAPTRGRSRLDDRTDTLVLPTVSEKLPSVASRGVASHDVDLHVYDSAGLHAFSTRPTPPRGRCSPATSSERHGDLQRRRPPDHPRVRLPGLLLQRLGPRRGDADDHSGGGAQTTRTFTLDREGECRRAGVPTTDPRRRGHGRGWRARRDRQLSRRRTPRADNGDARATSATSRPAAMTDDPTGANCLTIGFRCLSEEIPEFVGGIVQRRVHRRGGSRDIRLDRERGRDDHRARRTSRSTARARRHQRQHLRREPDDGGRGRGHRLRQLARRRSRPNARRSRLLSTGVANSPTTPTPPPPSRPMTARRRATATPTISTAAPGNAYDGPRSCGSTSTLRPGRTASRSGSGSSPRSTPGGDDQRRLHRRARHAPTGPSARPDSSISAPEQLRVRLERRSVVSVNTSGSAQFTAAEAAGTAYAVATQRFSAAREADPRGARAVPLDLRPGRPDRCDSAVFVDRVTLLADRARWLRRRRPERRRAAGGHARRLAVDAGRRDADAERHGGRRARRRQRRDRERLRRRRRGRRARADAGRDAQRRRLGRRRRGARRPAPTPRRPSRPTSPATRA